MTETRVPPPPEPSPPEPASSDSAPPMSGRRKLLLGAAVGVGALAWWQGAPLVRRMMAGDFDFEPIEDLPGGFRRIAAGEVSSGFNPLIGVGEEATEAEKRTAARLRADLCAALFGAAPPPGVVPVASFSDYNCPYCRILTKILARIAAESNGAVRVTWHELPLLGDDSVIAARAALAADMQGAYLEIHKSLMRARFLASPKYLERLAGKLGIDPARMAADMRSEAVTRRIDEALALSDIFAFPGTPTLVVGRTVAPGAMTEETLRALIARERADGPVPACTAA